MSLLNKVTHYQKKIERNREHTETLVRCINKLHKLPITGQHLEKTGIGKTINALRKSDGDVGNAAKALVWKWKRVVFEETIAEEKAKKEKDLRNPITVTNPDENFLNAVKREEEPKETAYIMEDTNSTLSTVTGNDDANLSCNTSEYDTQRRDALYQSTEGENKVHSSTKSVSHVLGINRSSTKTHKQKGSHYRNRTSKHSHTRKDKPSHNKKSRENGIKIKLKKVHTEDESNEQEENESYSSGSFSKLKHCSKRAENETKSSESKLCRKERGQKRKTGRCEKCTENISKQSKSSEKVKKKFACDGGSIDYFAEELRLGDAVENKRPGSTTTSAIRNSDSISSSDTKTTNYSTNSNRKVVPIKPDLCLVDAKLEPLDVKVELASMLPEISSNKPFPHLPLTEEDPTLKHATKEVSLTKHHRQRMKAYSCMKTQKPFPTLYNLCIHVLKQHIDALEYTGGVPYNILKPILQQATPEQLFQVEYYNPYLLEDTNELWEFHCQKKFPSSQLKRTETAREMYLRCLEEREAKFKALTSNIQQSLTKALPVRQMKLAYVDSVPKPPRNVAREQAKYGTGNIPKSDGGKPRRNTSTSSATLNFFKNSANSAARKKPRMAPLMKKTMKLAKSFKR